ncbi:50S ribosomal protein L29 [Helcococcus ovis]|uniref:Large ribosomal subunit protein uL29 n=2 Tax=Helcococcus TaxID=31983 RepID=A0A4R9C382_9FIRM|nr:50S ribosomal protein L29 [Helcococcus ovis]TFF66222.1 50S ribosomal protein L29 [Helcococcus ovis]TFF66341.1 50S ribosomal protein L29 [Helcococcus ovis]TFF67299.1 50S ribosomal protein L29 [Helcococcus ovis]WNZ00951.1 50S ribosomal protein L29 [Helcococcus ovis]
MKATEIRKLSDKELNNKLLSLKEELFNLRFQAATGQIESMSSIGKIKQDIARVKTIITERKLNLNKEA